MISFFMMYESIKSERDYLLDFDAKNQFEGAIFTYAKTFNNAKKEIARTVEKSLRLGKKETDQIVSKSLKNIGLTRKDTLTDETISNITKSIIASYTDERSL